MRIYKKKALNIFLASSILFIFYFTIFNHQSLGIGSNAGGINLKPLVTIKMVPFKEMIINTLGNLVLFVPYGICISFKCKKQYRIFKVIITGFLFSLTIEVFQLFLSKRWTDVDDIILNTLGSFLGYLIFLIIDTRVNHKRKVNTILE
ncbi:VanZ family protein [Peribacillus sp. YIM B13472]|uniref:VanZ family protein n=1 Tax=Peribacillus sp. YIM B13472 TaxID=3366297 RepID=UPI00366D6565